MGEVVCLVFPQCPLHAEKWLDPSDKALDKGCTEKRNRLLARRSPDTPAGVADNGLVWLSGQRFQSAPRRVQAPRRGCFRVWEPLAVPPLSPHD